jgi:ATP-dependent DNA ligase
MNGADWSTRYPRIVEDAARLKGSAVIDAEVVCLDEKRLPNFNALQHCRSSCSRLCLRSADGHRRRVRRQPLRERKASPRQTPASVPG